MIGEYLQEAREPKLHPADPLERARHWGWIECASAILNNIAGLYSAVDEKAFELNRDELISEVAPIEKAFGNGPLFAVRDFCLVDAAFGPVFNYFDAFDSFVALGVFDASPLCAAWRCALNEHPSVVMRWMVDIPAAYQYSLLSTVPTSAH